MAQSCTQDVWNALRAKLGSDLRVVTRYDADDFETFMREDLREQYSSTDDREIVCDTIVQQLSLSEAADAFEAGSLEAAVRVFESAYVLTYPDPLDAKTGFIISIERGGESMTAVEEAIQFLAETIGER